MVRIRSDKLLSVLGYGTRTEVKKLIADSALCIDGRTVLRPETKCDPETERVELCGKRIFFTEYEYWVLNKPSGIITATRDNRHETVIDYMGLTRKGMSPCGRLDRDTEGLLLITDNGALIHRILSPALHIDKVYEAEGNGTIPEEAVQMFREGMVLSDGTRCLPADLSVKKPDTPFSASLTIREGKFHQVKRMFESVGCNVTHLRRIAVGPLNLQDLKLKEGEYRMLTEEEKNKILELLK